MPELVAWSFQSSISCCINFTGKSKVKSKGEGRTVRQITADADLKSELIGEVEGGGRDSRQVKCKRRDSGRGLLNRHCLQMFVLLPKFHTV
ncbi:AP2/ERF domain-containing protein [Psidium guajava]|nr:AP2/ERF domain-containing protein [Psidium guajava]